LRATYIPIPIFIKISIFADIYIYAVRKLMDIASNRKIRIEGIIEAGI
jgi:hypothetical protein